LKSWDIEHAKLIGRIIFADFLQLPLVKYKGFIENVEASPLFEKLLRKGVITKRFLSQREADCQIDSSLIMEPSRVIAKIERNSEGFSIRYTCAGFNAYYLCSGRVYSACSGAIHGTVPIVNFLIKAKLESEYGIKLSRHSIGIYRKDMGIPSSQRRLSGYKYPPLSANFSMLYPFILEEVLRNAPASPGIYEFRLKGEELEYPQCKTSVIYLGSARNLKKRLKEHLGQNSKNSHIKTFLEKYGCLFRYILVPQRWREEERKLYQLFVDTYGVPPRCNRVRP